MLPVDRPNTARLECQQLIPKIKTKLISIESQHKKAVIVVVLGLVVVVVVVDVVVIVVVIIIENLRVCMCVHV